MVRYFFAALLFVLSISSAAFGSPKVRLEVSPREGSTDDRFIFSVVVEGGSRADAPLLSGGDDFSLRLLGRQNNVQIINGDTRSQLAITYQLAPKHAGKLLTPSVEITVDGDTVKLEPLTISVQEGSGRKDASADKNVILEQTIDKSEVYVGEQVVNTIELASRINLINPRFDKLTFDGFWMEPFGNEKRTDRFQEGSYYSVYTIKRALFPLAPDPKGVIPHREISASVLDRRRQGVMGGNPFDPDFFDQFLGATSYEEKTFRSSPLSIVINPLPAPERPLEGWNPLTPLVGETSLQVIYDPTPIKVGEAKTATYTLRTTGNANPIKEISIPSSPLYKSYMDSPMVNSEEAQGLLVSVRTFKVSVVPAFGGTISIPSIRIPYFDPKRRAYRFTDSGEVTFEVAGPPPPKFTPEPLVTQRGTPSESEAPLPYEEAGFFRSLSDRISAGSLILFLVGIVGAFTVIRYAARISHLKKPIGDAERRLASSRDPSQLRDAFITLLSLKIGSPEPLLRSELRAKLSDRDLWFSIEEILDTCDEAEYGGGLEEAAFARLRIGAVEISRFV